MSDGAHHSFETDIPDDAHQRANYVVGLGAAWFTAGGGILADWTHDASERYGAGSIKTGTRHSGKSILSLTRLAMLPIELPQFGTRLLAIPCLNCSKLNRQFLGRSRKIFTSGYTI